ncbi:uncharacterized protein LOC118439057 [Folsomia candida]|nr:uncharacterized protein LOC118439057 [Folsomia candida]
MFSYLDTHCVKSFRAISTTWNAIGATVLGTRTIFPMEDFQKNFATPEEIQKINPALVKRISLRDTRLSFYNPFTSVTSSWWRHIREIRLIMIPEVWPGFVEILMADGLPNLVRLALTKSYHDHTYINFRPVSLINLKVFEFYQIRDVEMHNVNINLQTIIDSAPNLKSLKIHGYFFPDLGKYGKILKNLEWHAVSIFGARIQSLEPLHPFLSQVSPTLEHLSLGIKFTLHYKKPDQLPITAIPPFPRLKSFQNLASDVFQIDVDFKNFPKLITLSQQPFRLTRELVQLDVDRNRPVESGIRHEGITKLQVGNICDLIMVSLAPVKFPSVTQLTLEILPQDAGRNIYSNAEYLEESIYIAEIIETCASWKLLTHLDIVLLIYEPRLSNVVEALHSSLDVNSGLTELKIVCRGDYFEPDDEISKQRTVFDDLPCDGGKLFEFISNCGALKRLTFQGIWWKPTSMVRIMDFLANRKSSLPIVIFE